jgi:hypothetical protein
MGLAILGGFWTGVILLIILTPTAAVAHRYYRRTWQVGTTATLTCAQLRETPLPQVAVTGRTSSREIITAPVSGEPCVCYWTELTEFTSEGSESQSHVRDRRSVGRIVIEDETGTAVISTELALRCLTRTSGRLATRETHKWDNYVEKIWYVRPGAPVYVIGSVNRDGDGPPLLHGKGGTSTRAYSDVVDQLHARDTRWAATARASALVGLIAINVTTALIIIGVH